MWVLSCTSRGCARTLSRGPHVLDQRQKSHLLQPSGCYSMADTWDDYLPVSEGFGKEMIQSAGPLGYKGKAQQRNWGCASGRNVHSLLCCKRTQWLPCHVRYLSLIKELSYEGTYCRARSCSDQSRRDEQRWTRSNRSSAVLEHSAPPPGSSPKPEVTTSQTGSEKERPQPQFN